MCENMGLMIETFAALAEPNRLRIMEFLREGPRSVGEIAHELKLNQPQASKHLAILRTASFVQVDQIAQYRMHRLSPVGLGQLGAWLDRYRAVWDVRFEQLDDVLRELNETKRQENG